ncbi:MAG: S41 family peptidase [Planctomycetaceae bacterium]|nr:S41 family peptidase [Planctomycetaceae bacterium]
MQTTLNRFCWILTAAFLLAAAWTGIAKAQSESDEYYELMRVFVDTFEEIDKNYVNEVDKRRLVEAAVRGMLAELDPYSNYIGPNDIDVFTESISQEFGGVGIRVNYDRQRRAIEVMTPLPGSPAYEAGIHSGDFIVEIDGKPVKDFELDQELETAVELLRGKPGEEVELGYLRGESKDIARVKLKRDIIQLETVLGYSYDDTGKWDLMLDDEQKIGYIRLTQFTKRSPAEVREALKNLRKDGMKGLILDLRTNPGGLLQAAVDISDMFIEEGVIVSTEGRNSPSRTWSAKRFGTFTGFPMAVLINNYSASASEIVSACLQDHDRAVVIGERSWGKGSVQDVIDLEGGKSALKLTTASYHRPSGKNIHRFPNSKEDDEWGVMPNDGFVIDFTPQETLEYQRDRRERDVLGRTEEYQSSFVDRQLEVAREYLEKQLVEDTSGADGAEEKKAAEENNPPAANDQEKKAAFRWPLIPMGWRGRAA